MRNVVPDEGDASGGCDQEGMAERDVLGQRDNQQVENHQGTADQAVLHRMDRTLPEHIEQEEAREREAHEQESVLNGPLELLVEIGRLHQRNTESRSLETV